ncbi:AlwI family type II restriction endonuclease [Ruminococcus flavefaciens]|uniref:AlwI family type II restriction endonuclease n=1 Tax=Ruminococcus flavefaciens TaxID=1265 RepID=UPI00048F821D|nr:AlwI family type II restriction endonuclease [Ruminococcus flavefaciens]
MRVKEKQIFNLMDTNGRRNDVINALQGYLTILDDLLRNKKMTWNHLPESFSQLNFYQQAIALSPDVFQKHDKYDNLISQLDKNPVLKQAVLNQDIQGIEGCLTSNHDWFDELDKSVEARARHYTSNLVKLGLTDDYRHISIVGDVLLGKVALDKDEFEAMLPLNDTNIVYLRQLLKLRIFDIAGVKYYSPFCMALYALLHKDRISQDEFFEIIQGLSPYHRIDDYDVFLDNYAKDSIIQSYSFDIPADINNDDIISFEVFSKHFKNQKSSATIADYYKFYKAIRDFIAKKDVATLDKMLTTYEDNRSALCKAFGYGSGIFKSKRGERPSVESFLKKEDLDIFKGNLNSIIYLRFVRSKTIDIIREYSDTTMRIFKATGIISFDKGYVELTCRELCKHIFNIDSVKAQIFGDISIESVNNVEDYEEKTHSYYLTNHSIISILNYSEELISDILIAVQNEFEGHEISEIHDIVNEKRKEEFVHFIEEKYPETRVKKLMCMFADRTNDKAIKEEVCPDSTVPTIYEYIVGLAWYYFSNKTIDLLNSYNLTLSADFEPLTHASGGMGDIVIREKSQVVMLEATLMNANSQKRGEWEPVLRHSVNLKIEEENGEGRDVTTFFVADTFDFNTINIWKAISSVPLQSSTDKTKYTDSVIIMPINTNELVLLMEEHKHEYHKIIKQVRELFLKDITKFDESWRDKFIASVL